MSLSTYTYQAAMADLDAGLKVTRLGWSFSRGHLVRTNGITLLCIDGVVVIWRPMQVDVDADDWVPLQQ